MSVAPSAAYVGAVRGRRSLSVIAEQFAARPSSASLAVNHFDWGLLRKARP
jgi:hypothetical protein